MHALSILSLGAITSFMPVALAVCASGDVGVAYRAEAQYEGGVAQLTLYSGSIVTNNCDILASNGETQNTNQWCLGGYDDSSTVDCQGGSDPVTVIDGSGISYTCSGNTDTSCNEPGFTVDVCCSRD